MNDYLVIYETDGNGAWGAYLPDIDGVVALGETRQEVEALMREALDAHLTCQREQGMALPEPRNFAGYVVA